jgi:hypothetical protein
MGIIYKFSNRRGRPQSDKNIATPELMAKHSAKQTMDALDMVLHKGLITEEQHKAGMHLRWLHNLRFGDLKVRAYNIDWLVQAGYAYIHNEKWMAARQTEYAIIINYLKHIGSYTNIANLCIYSLKPAFINRKPNEDNYSIVKDIQYGLDCVIKILDKLYNKK